MGDIHTCYFLFLICICHTEFSQCSPLWLKSYLFSVFYHCSCDVYLKKNFHLYLSLELCQLDFHHVLCYYFHFMFCMHCWDILASKDYFLFNFLDILGSYWPIIVIWFIMWHSHCVFCILLLFSFIFLLLWWCLAGMVSIVFLLLWARTLHSHGQLFVRKRRYE